MKKVAQQFANANVAPRLSPGQSLQPELRKVAETFVDLQEARHEADYNTAWRATRPDTVGVIEQTEQAFSAWRTVRRTVQADTFLVGLLAYNQMRG